MKNKTRAAALKRIGIYKEVMWHENFPEDREGDFDRERTLLESESLERVFDRWCRGQNLRGFSELIICRLNSIRRICKNNVAKKPEMR